MESMTRLSSMLETARDLTLEASSAARSKPSRPLPAQQLKKLLDSRHDREVLEGLRRVISMYYRNQPTLPFFSAVIKNIASPSLEIKKLVYIYLLHHAEADPDTALLSINTIQKSLTDSNPQLRALALRVMSGIRVPVISQIVQLGIKRGAGDMSPYVRKAAALAIPKCYNLDPNGLPQLMDSLSTLLGDKQYYVAGAAVDAFLRVCPERLDLIHPHYRTLIRKLVDMDEWGQLATLRLMTIYAPRCFPRRTRRVKKKSKAEGNGTGKNTKGFYDDSSSESDSEANAESIETEEVILLDPDLELLLKSLSPLLQSRNSAVIVAVSRCYLHLGNTTYLDKAIGPLISLIRSSSDIHLPALHNAVRVCMVRPEPFVRYASHFLLRCTDAPQVWALKLELLTLIFPHCPAHVQSLILAELAHFTGGHDAALVREAVRAIGRCAQRTQDTATAARCLRLLLSQISSPDPRLVAEALEVVRHLIQRDPLAHRSTVIRLAKNLDTATSPQARASIIWLVGEFASIDPENNIAADVLRILTRGFTNEAEEAKLQILLLAAKVYLQHLILTQPAKPVTSDPANEKPTSTIIPATEEGGFGEQEGGFGEYNSEMSAEKSSPPDMPKETPHQIPLLYNYILLLTRYDTSYDLRDRARVYRALLAVPSSTELASLLLLAPKPVPQTPSPSESRSSYTLGSASLIIGDEAGLGGLGVKGYEELPDWVQEGEEPDARLREEMGGRADYGAESRVVPAGERLDVAAKESGGFDVQKSNGVKEKTLDDWLAEDEEETDSGETESEEESEYETEEGSTEEESEEEDENDKLVK